MEVNVRRTPADYVTDAIAIGFMNLFFFIMYAGCFIFFALFGGGAAAVALYALGVPYPIGPYAALAFGCLCGIYATVAEIRSIY